MPHKGVLLAAVAGLLCLPATYSVSRSGSLSLSIMIAVAVCSAATWIGAEQARPVPRVAAFFLGAAVAEGTAFLYYYLIYGSNDPKLSVGVAVSIIELLSILVVGVSTLLVVPFLTRRMRSNAA